MCVCNLYTFMINMSLVPQLLLLHIILSEHLCVLITAEFVLRHSNFQSTFCRNHTLALVRGTGRIYGCGLGGSGQLGTGQLANQKSPCPVRGNWCPLSTGRQGVPVDKSFLVKRLFAGGDQSFATFTMPYVSVEYLHPYQFESCTKHIL